MNPLLEWIVTAALSLCFLIALAWVLSLVLRRWSNARLAYAAWLVPLAILLPSGLIPAAGLELPAIVVGTSIAATAPAAAQEGSAWTSLLVAIWAAGMLIHAATLALRQRRFVRRLAGQRVSAATPQDRLHPAVPVYYSRACAAPLLVGVFPPRLYLPAAEDRPHRWVVEHEMAHLRHGDPMWNLIAASLQVVFWFHPLVHLAVGRFRRDQELAADESVIAGLDPAQRRAYARLLVVENTVGAAPLAVSWKSVHPIKERVMRTLNHRIPRHGALAGCLLLAGGLIAGGLVAAGPSEPSSPASLESADRPEAGEEGLRALVRVPPKYPRSAAENGITGWVMLEGTIDDDGSLSGIRVVESEPEGVFEDQAVAAFEQWRFETSDDQTGRQVHQRIDFALDPPDDPGPDHK